MDVEGVQGLLPLDLCQESMFYEQYMVRNDNLDVTRQQCDVQTFKGNPETS